MLDSNAPKRGLAKCQPLRLMLLLAVTLSAACEMRPTNMAMVNAQPNAPAQRNHTNFYPALQCMDNLFVEAKRPRVMISSNQIPDRTRSIAVDTRGMIITALNHMSRRSKAFVFVEQGLVGRTAGDTLALERDDPKGDRPPAPVLYVNGAISQIDKGARNTTVETNLSGFEPADNRLSTSDQVTGVDHSVVSLDLHLVSFPSRVVIPGSAVSNSITVKSKRWATGLAGYITQRTLGISFEVETVESRGQAVRSLIELGLIEMLGNYTGVPFWECLSQPEANAQQADLAEREHIREGIDPDRLRMAQYVLGALGYVEVQTTGKMDKKTRKALAAFQAQQGIVANGTLDFDTYQALEKERVAMQPKPVRPRRSEPRKPADDGGYQTLQVFVDDMF